MINFIPLPDIATLDAKYEQKKAICLYNHFTIKYLVLADN